MSKARREDARAFALEVAARQFAELRAHEAGTRLGEDPEELHDMRVAIRRFRTLIRVFEGLLPWSLVAQHDELRHTGLILGAVRDLDIQIDALRAGMKDALPADCAALECILQALGAQRADARKQLVDSLDSLRFRQMTATIEVALKCGAGEEAETPAIGDWAAKAVLKTYKRFRKTADEAAAEAPAEQLHLLRRRAKRLRYTVEFVQELYPKSAPSLLRALEPLQDLLGEHQDCVASIARLRGLALETDGLSREAVLQTGGLIAEKQHRMRELRDELPAALAHVQQAWKPLRRHL